MQKPWGRAAYYGLASPGLPSLLSYRAQDDQAGMASSIDDQLRKCLPVGSHGGIPSTEATSSLMTLAYTKMTHEISQSVVLLPGLLIHDYGPS